jgi:hypothetical protein
MSLKIQAALLPQKHISFSGSLVGLAGRVRSALWKAPRTIDQLIAELARNEEASGDAASVEHLVLAVTLLYAIGQAQMDEQDRLVGSR